ncbi:hypothetical protein [Nannocystis bainbridge]|uniref:Intracellular septation protein A n=1 Tax=Nannocystis bainbridge TaxID=2995303 RepID=A0ABT5DZZ7_9BACT|nr:hypothetical protein [Nannocystis bainbridge]MDC0719202.1 hypothetical protein [Nannocystis bainbridge]
MLRSIVIGGYPLVVYFGMTRWNPRTLALVLAVALLPGLVLRLREARREDLWPVLRVPLSLFGLFAVAALSGEQRLFMALPVLVNLGLLANFAASLRGPVSLVERFARLQEPELPPGGPAYCRTWTKIWCGFFVANAAVSAGLALWAPASWWMLYTGLLGYLLIGVMFTVEFIVRKVTFRRFGDGLPDRLLRRLLRA